MNYDSYRTAMKADFLYGMEPSGEWDIPTIHRSNAKPNLLIPFDKAVSGGETSGWVHFFTYDSKLLQKIARLLLN